MKKKVKISKAEQIYKYLFLFLFGGILYYSLEIIFRGHSHYSMFMAGGMAIVLINISRKLSFIKRRNIFVKAVAGGLIITAIEFVIGVVFNLFLKQNVWNYAKLPLNVLGQICIPFTLLWIMLSFPALFICKFFDETLSSIVYNIKEKSKQRYL